MRQIGKQILTLTKSYTTFCLLFLALCLATAAPAQEKSIITNALTGVALSGFDPVAYFRIIGGRLMLFYSIGNRAAFDMAPGTALATAAVNWEALPDRRAAQHR